MKEKTTQNNLARSSNPGRFSIFSACLCGLLLVACVFLYASQAAAEPLATLYSASGQVEGRFGGSSEWRPARKGQVFESGDEIKTGALSRAGLKFSGGKLARLRDNSYLKIESPVKKEKPEPRLSLFSGVTYLFSRKSSKFNEIKTPEVSAAIRGTELTVKTEAGETTVTVLKGDVTLENASGTLALKAGEAGTARANQAPVKKIMVNPMDSVDWALYYPSVMDPGDFADFQEALTAEQKEGLGYLNSGNLSAAEPFFKGTAWTDIFGSALMALGRDDSQKALELLNSIPERRPASATLLQADIYLSAGQVRAAGSNLAALETSIGTPASETEKRLLAAAYARQAIVQVVQNNRDTALELAKKANSLSPDSISALVARSYVHQSRFELDQAEEWISRALELDRQNSFALSRLAELQLASGRLAEGVKYATQAIVFNPEDSFALTTLGFAKLTRYETGPAKSFFNRAIATGNAGGLPHLGLGLAKIREGDLEAGRAEIEKAVVLEPGVSIYRSYLGKAFFEEEDEDLAAEEYARAVELDPQDPTPYLYRAFNHLSKNRPVDALNDVEDSIERNNNRAVYRSKLLLDQDLGVRSTSLAEVFNQIGFSRIAQLEAIKSINLDYTNYSAHRLLADSYSSDLFADARFTENVVANLLAPVSFNVFSDLNGFGTDAALNEYSALFDRDQHRTGLAAGGRGADDEFLGNVFQTGKMDRFGYFAGYQTLYGRGRKAGGNYERENRFDLATQYQLSYEHRLIMQTAFIRREDSRQEYDYKLDDYEVSLGSQHKFSPEASLINRFEYLNRDFDESEYFISRQVWEQLVLDGVTSSEMSDLLGVDQYSDDKTNTYRYSSQFIYKSELVSVVTGVQFLDTDLDANENSEVVEGSSDLAVFPGEELSSGADFDGSSFSTYLYSTWHLSEYFEADLGVNYTDMDLPEFDVIPPYLDGKRTEDRVSPKFGLSVYPTSDTTIRSAYFQSLGISTVSDIGTLEPTLVGSFTQVYNDLPGTRVDTTAVGIDHKWPRQAYMGVEYQYRDLERDTVEIDNALIIDLDNLTEQSDFRISSYDEDEQQHFIRSYLYYVLCSDMTATLDYTRSDFDLDSPNEENKTDRIQMGLNYFSVDRWFSFTRASWYHQELSDVPGFDNGTSTFWLVDAGVGYRLPKRRGSLRVVFRNLLGENFDFEDRGFENRVDPDFNISFEASYNF